MLTRIQSGNEACIVDGSFHGKEEIYLDTAEAKRLKVCSAVVGAWICPRRLRNRGQPVGDLRRRRRLSPRSTT